jgi:hypothetical protein
VILTVWIFDDALSGGVGTGALTKILTHGSADNLGARLKHSRWIIVLVGLNGLKGSRRWVSQGIEARKTY